MSNKKKTANSGGGGAWQKEEEDVQVIVIADSFDRKFAPITYEEPRVLLPLANKPIIDYTIEYLMEQDVQEIIVFCCSFGDKIKEHISTRWSSLHLNIHCVMSSTENCLSIGDALREIDREGLIRSDFVLVFGDMLSNVKLSEIIKDHKVKRKKEKNLMMTTLHRKLPPNHFSRCSDDDSAIIMECSTNRLIHCQRLNDCKKFGFPKCMLNHQQQIDIRYDLVPCHIFVCSPHVAPLFTDNFDYQTLDDFIKGIQINEEILGDQIHVCVIEDGYASRVSDLHMYNAVSLDLLNRWIYPLVIVSPTFKRNNVYLQLHTSLDRYCSLLGSVLIGENTTVDENTTITKSVIGANCTIGKNVTIENSYIWNNSVIEDNCSVEQSVICSKCHLKQFVHVIDSILSYGVCIDERVSLPPSTRLSLINQSTIEDEFASMKVNDGTGEVFNKEIVGQNGKGYLWPFNEDIEGVFPSLTGNNYESSEDDESSEEDECSLPASPPNELSNLHLFHVEVVENLRCGIQENIAAENISLEINASKFKYNISIPELCETLVKGLLELSVDETSTKTTVDELELNIQRMRTLLMKYLNNVDAQTHALTAAEDFFSGMLHMGGLLATLLHKFYDKDIVDESVILKWFERAPLVDDPLLQRNYDELRRNHTLLKFITWLTEAEEEDSEDD